jgi:hypothetical protein
MLSTKNNHNRLFKNIDLSKISYSELDKYVQISYYNNKLQFWTPVMFCPFGIEKSYNNYVLKLSFVKKSNNEKICNTDFLDFIKSIEKKNMEHVDILENTYISQVFVKEGYDPMLTVKLPYNNNKLLVEFKNKEGETIVSDDIKKCQNLQVLLEVDSLWNFNDKYSCKFKAKTIVLS